MQVYNELCDHATDLFAIDIRKTKRRDADVVRVRYAIANIMLRYTGVNTVQLGQLMRKDHSTVVYYRSCHRGRYKSDEEYADVFDKLSAKIKDQDDEVEDIIPVIKMIGQ